MQSLPIEVRPHPTKRRALFATRSFSPSQVIHAFPPLLLTVASPAIGLFCNYCLKSPGGGDANLLACSRCRQSFYCGAGCQALDWKAVHSKECKQLRNLPAQDDGSRRRLPTPVRALVQCLLKREIAEGVAGLEGHLEEKRRKGGKEWEELTLMAMGGCAYSGKGQDPRELAKAQDLLAKLQTNAFYQNDADNGQTSLFVEPTLAMANHSCVPNASARFVGRMAVLTAEATIKEGEEIEISYIDYTNQRQRRRADLAGYFFECRCQRCEANLNVYQVAARSPLVPLNWYSVMTDEEQLRNHPGSTDSRKIQTIQRFSTHVGDVKSSEWLNISPAERQRLLREDFSSCKTLIEEDLWAVSPLPSLLDYAARLYGDNENFEKALAVRCLIATACDAYRRMNPGDADRVANLALMCRLLSSTASETASGSSSSMHGLRRRIEETLGEIDQVSLCQMLLTMVVKYGQSGAGKEDDLAENRKALEDIEALEGREGELSLIHAWREDAQLESSRSFFDYAVVKPVGRLAVLGGELIKRELQLL